jgi:hypothetical protein
VSTSAGFVAFAASSFRILYIETNGTNWAIELPTAKIIEPMSHHFLVPAISMSRSKPDFLLVFAMVFFRLGHPNSSIFVD